MPGNDFSRSTLPLRLTSFVGRAVELAELRRLLRDRRLVTLTGPGGAGKTRLALETTAGVAPDFAGRAFLVDLAALTRSELLLDTVCRAFPMESNSSRPLVDALADFLCGHSTLLILDNCEHLLDACAELAVTLLGACSTLTVLATSREPLGVDGECTFRVPLLSFPEPDRPPALSQMLEFEAIQLFVDRARLAEPSFALTSDKAPLVARICARLDGIPLAIELAAAALRTASLSDIAARLDERFQLLVSPGRSLPRHQTLAALLDWSYGLLDLNQQGIFRRLGILPADWTLDAAEAICGDELAPNEALLVVLGLVNKSLVQVDLASGRYRLLETIRMYALAKLIAAGEREPAAQKLFEWCRRFLVGGAPHLDGPGQEQWFVRLERELPNYRAALEWAIDAGESEQAAELALGMWGFWSARAYHREARDWLQRILELPSALPATVRAHLLRGLGTLGHTLNDFAESTRYYAEELAIRRDLGDPNGIATALSDLAWLHFQKMDLTGAERYGEEGLALARQGGDAATVANALQILTATRIEAGQFEGVALMLEECLGIWRGLGVRRAEATTLAALARVVLQSGNHRKAAGLMLEALHLLSPLGDYSALIEHLVLMVSFEFDLRPSSPLAGQASGYGPLAYLKHGRLLHGPVMAARVVGAMAAWEDRIIGGNGVQWDAIVVPVCEKLKAEMGPAEFEREFAVGRSMSMDDIIDFAEDYPRSVLAAPPSQIRDTAGPRAARGPDALTAREMEVLRLVAEGLTNRQAAERLVVTPRTINAHLTSIYAKTGATSRTAAVRLAFERGLV